MKRTNKSTLVNIYNRPDTVIVVASYPARSDRSIAKIDAVASYTDHFTRSFRKTLSGKNRKLVILAQKIHGKEQWYVENGVLVARVWEKGSPITYVQVLKALLVFHRAQNVLVQFEFHQFGGNISTGLFPIFLGLARMLGKTITLTMHQVVEDIADLSGHLDIQKNTVKYHLFDLALKQFYRIVSPIPHALVVHSKILKDRLIRLSGRSDISVIPHGLGAISCKYSKTAARKILGIDKNENVLLSFGFLTWYKGSDWLIRSFIDVVKPDMRLIMAGGESPNLSGKPHYQKFLHTLYKDARKSKQVTITGFVSDNEIGLYFAACDMVVLPYRALISSSGPFAMTLSMGKPFILSKALSPYLTDRDFSYSMGRLSLTESDLVFPLKKQTLSNTLANAKTNQKKLTALSKSLATHRSWQIVAEQFLTTINTAALANYRKGGIIKYALNAVYAKQFSISSR